jgi:hypothetical protein
VDIVNSEILIPSDQIELYNRLSQGQVLTYTVQVDSASGQDSFPIGGVTSGIDYYLIKKGIDANGRGRLALAATPDDVVANNWVVFSAPGVGSVHLLSGELGKTARLTLSPDLAITPQAVSAVAQSTALQLSGTYGNGDTITLWFLNDRSGSDAQVFSHTFTGLSGDQSQIQIQAVQQLVAALNATDAIGSGVGAFLRASVDPASLATLLFNATEAGVPFSVNATASNASVAKISQLLLQGSFQSGDQIQFTIARGDGSDPTPFSYTTVSSDSGEITRALALFLQGQPFATASTGYLTVGVDSTNPASIIFTALVPGEGFLIKDLAVIPTSGDGDSGILQEVTIRENVRDTTTDPGLNFTGGTDAVIAPNWLGPVFRVSAIDGQASSIPPESLVSNQVAALSQGLFQAGDGIFLGAVLFLSKEVDSSSNTVLTRF